MTHAADLAILMESLYTGGVGKMRLHLMNEIAARGFSVDLVLADMSSPYMPMVHPAVRKVKIASADGVKGVPSMAWYLARNKPRVMLTQRVRLNVLALRAKRLIGSDTRIVVTVNVNMSSKFEDQSPQKRARQIQHLQKWFPRNDGIISVSTGVAEDAARLIGIPVSRIRVIQNPTITPDLLPRAAEPLDHPWFQPGQPPVALGVGRLMKEKDFPTLIRAFALLRARRACRLVILGEGPDRASLEALVAEMGLQSDVALPGFATNPYAYMARAAMFVLSSTREGSPNALTEALAVGVPLVSTDCPNGPPDVLEGGRHGLLVPMRDPPALAAAMEQTLDRPVGDRESRMASARRYTVERSATLYLHALGLGPDEDGRKP